MAANADFNRSALLESDSELRALVNAILGGHTRGDTYLNDVFSICRRKPQSAGVLRELIDRHQRLGKMPRTQHRKIRARIEQAMPRPMVRSPAVSPATSPDDGRSDADALEERTCDLSEEPIAAATRAAAAASSRREAPKAVAPAAAISSLLDTNPTLETPPPRSTSRTAARSMSPSFIERSDLVLERSQLLASRNERIAEIAAIFAENADLFAERRDMPPLMRPPQAHSPVAAPPLPPAVAVPASGSPPEDATVAIEATAILSAEPAPVAAASTAAAAAPRSEPALLTGQKLSDRYELQVLLGRGGMASVYKAVDRERVRMGFSDRFVALKVVETDAAHPSRSAALLQEFQSAQRLSHPNIINVFEIDQVQGATFYSMELLSGARLSQLLRRVDGSVLQRRYALAIIRDIGAAISHAHSRGVVHSDLKPSNVMITQAGEVRVLDFGGSSMPPREPWVSDSDGDDAYHHATPAYASCEQLERRRADPRDDIYALACIAYLLLSGRHPFDFLSSLEARARGMQPRRPAGISQPQWRAIREGLTFAREHQPASVEAWLGRLGLRAAAAQLPPLEELTAPVEPERPVLRATLATAAVLATLGGAWLLADDMDPDWQQQVASEVSTAWDSALALLVESPHSRQVAPHSAPAPTSPSAKAAPAASAPVVIAPPVAARAIVQPVVTKPAVNSRIIAPVATANADADVTATRADATAPRVSFAAQSYYVGPGDPAARIVVQRQPGSQGDLNFIWWTEGASAEPDVDYAPLGARSERLVSGQDKLTVYVPIISNPLRTKPTQFRVALVDATSHRGEGSAPSVHATVTIEGGR